MVHEDSRVHLHGTQETQTNKSEQFQHPNAAFLLSIYFTGFYLSGKRADSLSAVREKLSIQRRNTTVRYPPLAGLDASEHLIQVSN
mmetsp:Transcript_35746/g.43150  ORF Transcript_35746/g.43150 Transcript_35746/m.43150 type:complete len:86 (-) Transcript_35746:361-618(-)